GDAVRFHVLDDVEAGNFRNHQVEDDDRVFAGAEFLDGNPAVNGNVHVDAFPAEQLFDEPPNGRIVFDDERAITSFRRGAVAWEHENECSSWFVRVTRR